MKKNILIIVLVIVVLVLGYFVWAKKAVAPVDQTVTKTWAHYQSDAYGFGFDYPAEMVKGEGKIFLPGPAPEAVPAVTFTRVLKEPHPLMSGETEPTTDNPKISVAVLGGFIDDIAKDFADYEPLGQNMFRAGVEGEGVIYRLFKLNGTTTLLIMNNFIDERNVLNYQKVSGYLNLTEQENYVQDILATLEIN